MRSLIVSWCCCSCGGIDVNGPKHRLNTIGPGAGDEEQGDGDAAAGIDDSANLMPKAAQVQSNMLWSKAIEVVESTNRSDGFEDDGRGSVLLDALTADPDAAQRTVTNFVQQAVDGIEVEIPRQQAHEPNLRGHFILGRGLEDFKLRIAGRERRIRLHDVARVSAGIPGGEEFLASPNSATIELVTGDGVVLSLLSEELRNELVLCLMILADAAKGHSLRLISQCTTTASLPLPSELPSGMA